MNHKNQLCLFFLVLLLSPNDIMTEDKKKEVRQVPLPLVYVGAIVSPEIYLALLVAYGSAALIKYGVQKATSDSHSCANNRGWCRETCHRGEYVDKYHSDVCGSYSFCRYP